MSICMSIWDALNIIRPHRRHAVLDAVHYYRCREYMYLSHVGQTMCCAYCAKTAEPVVWRITIFDGIAAWRSRRSFRLCYTNVVCSSQVCAPTCVGTGPADQAAAGPVILQTIIFMFTLYQLLWTWNEPWSFFLFGHCRFFCNLPLILLSAKPLWGEGGLP